MCFSGVTKKCCQFQPFNSIYQLYADKEAGRLEGVTNLLMIPEYLMYKLCGVKAREYTNATTMGLVSGQTGISWSRSILTNGWISAKSGAWAVTSILPSLAIPRQTA